MAILTYINLIQKMKYAIDTVNDFAFIFQPENI